MKSYFYYLISATALFWLVLTGTASVAQNNPYGSATTGLGVNNEPNHGNTNVPFDSWSGLVNNSPNPFVKDINPTTNDPYDETPIHELTNVNQDNSGQQISDYVASNGRGVPSAGTIGTFKQTPIGRTGVNPGTTLPGLQPTYTALQAGAIPGQPGIYTFTEIPFESGYNYSFGFNTNAQPQGYFGYNHPNYNAPATYQSGGWLPPTSTAAADINNVDSNGLRISSPDQSAQSFLTLP
jgi:hypothetical protein